MVAGVPSFNFSTAGFIVVPVLTFKFDLFAPFFVAFLTGFLVATFLGAAFFTVRFTAFFTPCFAALFLAVVPAQAGSHRFGSSVGAELSVRFADRVTFSLRGQRESNQR